MTSSLRTGLGSDAHRFSNDGTCALVGLQWPGTKKLEGHSDGDVAIHAICDALLSAAGLGDIGLVFGVDRPEMKDATGASMASHVVKLLSEKSISIVNIAVNVIGNQPRINSRRDEAEKTLSSLFGAPVSLSATSTDGMGFTGRGEGIFASSSALIELK
jgi:2-C-methyl-D-erythritol 2,4-cyclodiphosphate synthase